MKLVWISTVWSFLQCASLLAFAAPQAATHGPCSGIAAEGGTVHTRCTFNLPEVSRGRLVIQEVWLVPTIGFMSPTPKGSRNEHVSMTAVVRNLTDKDVLINATTLEIHRSRRIEVQPSLSGVGVIGHSINDNVPIRIEAGKTGRITLGDTLNLPDIINGVENSIELADVMVMDELDPPRSNGAEYVEKVGQLISKMYGKNARLTASFFTGDYQVVARFDIPLDKGVDFFYRGERFDRKLKRQVFQPLLAYDAFLGCYLKQKERWVVGFKIHETPRQCIDVVPDPGVSGGQRYRDAVCPSAPEPLSQEQKDRRNPCI